MELIINFELIVAKKHTVNNFLIHLLMEVWNMDMVVGIHVVIDWYKYNNIMKKNLPSSFNCEKYNIA